MRIIEVDCIKRDIYESFAEDFPQYVDITPNFTTLVHYMYEEELDNWKEYVNKWLVENHCITLEILCELTIYACCIEFLNKSKEHKRDIIYFNGEEAFTDAIKWGRENIDNFSIEMIY